MLSCGVRNGLRNGVMYFVRQLLENKFLSSTLNIHYQFRFYVKVISVVDAFILPFFLFIFLWGGGICENYIQ